MCAYTRPRYQVYRYTGSLVLWFTRSDIRYQLVSYAEYLMAKNIHTRNLVKNVSCLKALELMD